jgi:hypothetical protein
MFEVIFEEVSTHFFMFLVKFRCSFLCLKLYLKTLCCSFWFVKILLIIIANDECQQVPLYNIRFYSNSPKNIRFYS